MALTNALAAHGGKQPSAPDILIVLTVTPDNSYPAAAPPEGYDFDAPALARQFGNYDKEPQVKAVVGQPKAGHTFEYDSLNKKLRIFDPTGVELADTTDVAAALGGDFEVLLFAC